MNPDWLRYFTVLAETLNFHQAAERLHITPQALSKAIASLESHLGVTLVERSHRVEGLTSAGAAFLDEALQVLQSLENAERRMAEWREPVPQGPLTIAGDMLWHHYLMPDLLARLLADFPRVRPQVYEMLPDDVEKWVGQGEIEVGLLLKAPQHPELDWFEGMKTPYVIAGKPQPKQAWHEFGYIVPRFFQRSFTDSLDGWPEGKFKRRITAEVELVDTAIRLCEAGVGVAYLPELAVRERVTQGTLAIVADAPSVFHDQLFVVWRKGIRSSPAARELLSRLGCS